MTIPRILAVVFGIAVCLPSASAIQTPETRTLDASEADRALEHDWLFQAMGEPLLPRAEKEIVWARELAKRLAGRRQVPDLSTELRELEDLEKILLISRKRY